MENSKLAHSTYATPSQKKALTTRLAIATTILCLIPLFGLTRNTWAQEPTEAEITSQIENLKQADEFLVEDAVDALRKLGSPAIPKLIEALQSQNLQVREGAADALGRIGKPAIPDLLKGLKSDKPQVRWGAANALGRIGSDAKDAVPDLRVALKDKEARVRSSAADALGNIGSEASEAVPDLIVTLKDPEARVRSSAADALGNIGSEASEAVPDLIVTLKDKEARVRSSAANGLGGIGADAKDAVPDLIKALQDSDKDVRRSGADALGGIGNDAKKAVPDLIKALQDSDKDVRSYAAYALELIGRDAKAAVPNLIAMLKEDKEAQVRSWAADALGGIGAKEAVPDLRVALKEDKEAQIRRSAASALYNIGVEAKEAVPDLRAALKDSDKYVRIKAAYAVGAIGVEAKETVPDLKEALKDSDKDIRRSAAYSLGSIGAEAKEAVPDLIAALKDKDKYVRWNAAYGLGGIGADAQEAVPDLRAALKDSDKYMRWNAIDTLGKIGADAKEAIPDLKTALEDSDQNIRSSAAKALGLIAVSFQDKAKTLSAKELNQVTSDLEAALKILDASKNQFSPQLVDESIKNLRRGINTLKEQKNAQLMNWIRQNQWVIPLLGYLVFAPSLCFILLWKRPLWLLQLNESLEHSDVELPFLGGFKVSIRTLLFIQWFHYHPRVLDAWVNKHIRKARTEFAEKEAVRNHEVYIPIPIKLNGKPPTELTVEELRSSFNKNRDCLVIWGEGGSGKTNLVCQIAKWAMSEDKTKRLFDYLMIPVLIEQELDSEGKGEQSPLLRAIKGQLPDITDNEDDDISDKFLNYLLRRKRILVIVDHLSEMSEATRKQICPERSKEEFPISKLIVTSRKKQNFAVTGTTIQTQQIPGGKLYSFMQTYLAEKGKALSDDAEYHETCGQLCKLVGKHRNITVLLARLFADQKIAAKEGTFEHDGELSDNIPELMLSYLNILNKTNLDCGDEKWDDVTVQKDAKIIAWECLKSSYKAEPAKRQDVLDALECDNPEKHLNYLEKRLNLIQITGPAKDKVRFNIELLAEYLAGLHLVDVYGNNEENWCDFLKNADTKPGAPNSIQSFLVAVRDCCQAQKGVSDFGVNELNKRVDVASTEEPLQMSVV